MEVGIICDLNYNRTICFSNYFYAIKNLFGDVKLINNTSDLLNIKIVFVGNDHFSTHKNIWMKNEFINYCNSNNIKMVVFTAEKINNSFPWNLDIQNKLQEFNNLYQYVIDVEDSIIFNKKLFSASMSKHYDRFEMIDKKDRCIFIGKVYDDRNKLFTEINKIIPLDIFNNFNTWDEYMNKMNEYKYVLSPLSEFSANFFSLRFYETLLIHSIPIHQVKENTLSYYKKESEFDDCIYFQEPNELSDKIKNLSYHRSYNTIWLEDVIKKILLDDNLYE